MDRFQSDKDLIYNMRPIKFGAVWVVLGAAVMSWLFEHNFEGYQRAFTILGMCLFGYYFSRFFFRNVMGNSVVIYRDSEGHIRTEFCPQTVAPEAIASYSSLNLKLGGLLNRSVIINPQGRVRVDSVTAWKIYLKRPEYWAELRVIVEDGSENRVVLSPAAAIDFFERHVWRTTDKEERLFGSTADFPVIFECLKWTLQRYREDVRSFEEKVSELSQKNAELWQKSDQEKEKTLQLLQQAISRIHETRRFIRSREALEIRDWLFEEFKKIAGPKDGRIFHIELAINPKRTSSRENMKAKQ